MGGELSNTNTNMQSTKKSSRSSFEEADSFFDKDGNEHIVDEEGYCEECDDYHDY
jgi:hypothetical protein